MGVRQEGTNEPIVWSRPPPGWPWLPLRPHEAQSPSPLYSQFHLPQGRILHPQKHLPQRRSARHLRWALPHPSDVSPLNGFLLHGLRLPPHPLQQSRSLRFLCPSVLSNIVSPLEVSECQRRCALFCCGLCVWSCVFLTEECKPPCEASCEIALHGYIHY